MIYYSWALQFLSPRLLSIVSFSRALCFLRDKVYWEKKERVSNFTLFEYILATNHVSCSNSTRDAPAFDNSNMNVSVETLVDDRISIPSKSADKRTVAATRRASGGPT